MPARTEIAVENSSLVEAALRKRLELPTFDPTAMKLLYLDLIRVQSNLNPRQCDALACMAAVITDHAKEVGLENKAGFFKEQAEFWSKLSGELLNPSLVFV